jgi:hypothetical protein
VLSQIGRILFHVNHGTSLNERIIGVALGTIERNTLILVESLFEIIYNYETEKSSVDIQIHANIQIFPVVNSGFLSRDKDLVSFEEDTLRDTTVLNSVFQNVEGIIIEIIVNSAFADAVVFIRIFNDGLLEIGLEVQNLIISR